MVAIRTTCTWSIASRIVAAIIGGYALTSLITLALSLALPWVGVGEAEAVQLTTLLSFPLYAAIIIAAFHTRSAARVWMGLSVATLPCVLIVLATRVWGSF